ncbi:MULTISPECIES: hypothetical protein [unclassified Bradyrhizobium]|uniref:hypothetical protein n=1 Tax=Bradyrhizobium sp. USDA 4541 TaxID=2817704 RepID=UPI0020A2DF19|nr:hypothetical protein [Bradyrhizobium sp. USDA 4541]MCP1850277.1 hypothetical protein [Bradyrhizobium sp. USDA 4541]
MSIDQDDREPITPPEKNHPDDKVRSIVEAVASEVPLGGMVVKLAGDLVPTRAQKARNEWEGAISERTNEHSERLDRHAQMLAPSTRLSGTSVDLAVALARAPGDGMAGRGLTLDDLCKLLPEAAPKDVEKAAFDLNALGLTDIQRALGGHWWLRLNQMFYEQVDHQVMDWESTTEQDARTLVNLLLEDEGRERTSVLHAASGWEKRRFNPAFQFLLNIIPDERTSREIQPDYPSSSIFLLDEDKALLRRFLATR